MDVEAFLMGLLAGLCFLLAVWSTHQAIKAWQKGR